MRSRDYSGVLFVVLIVLFLVYGCEDETDGGPTGPDDAPVECGYPGPMGC